MSCQYALYIYIYNHNMLYTNVVYTSLYIYIYIYIPSIYLSIYLYIHVSRYTYKHSTSCPTAGLRRIPQESQWIREFCTDIYIYTYTSTSLHKKNHTFSRLSWSWLNASIGGITSKNRNLHGLAWMFVRFNQWSDHTSFIHSLLMI